MTARRRAEQKAGNVRRRNARHMLIGRVKAKAKVTLHHEHGGLGDAASFTRIENAPCFDHLAPSIREDGERKAQLAPYRRGLLRRVHGNGGDRGSGALEAGEVVAVLRQLAEAKGSPMPAIKNQYDGTARRQLREPPRAALGIGQLEVGHALTRTEPKVRGWTMSARFILGRDGRNVFGHKPIIALSPLTASGRG